MIKRGGGEKSEGAKVVALTILLAVFVGTVGYCLYLVLFLPGFSLGGLPG